MQVHKYTRKHVHKNTRTHVHKCTSTKVQKYTSTQLHKYTSTHILKYSSTQVYKYKGIIIYNILICLNGWETGWSLCKSRLAPIQGAKAFVVVQASLIPAPASAIRHSLSSPLLKFKKYQLVGLQLG